MNDEEIQAESFEDLLHTLKDPVDKKPRLTDKEMFDRDDFRTGTRSVLNPPTRNRTEDERKKMVALAM